MANTSDDFGIPLSILIRILFENEAAYFLIRIPVRKTSFEELRSHLFLPIGKIDKFQGRRCHLNSLKNQMTAEFFKNFDQDTVGKL